MADGTCSVDGCDKGGGWLRRGLCSMHYSRLMRYGDVNTVPSRKRPKVPCSMPLCERPARTRGLCTTHYDRLRKHGDPTVSLAPTPKASAIERAWRLIIRDGETGCWPWGGALDSDGYGHLMSDAKKRQHAHRVIYEVLVEPIAAELVLDHLCRNKACVNPSHMEPVTHRENTRRHYHQQRADLLVASGLGEGDQ